MHTVILIGPPGSGKSTCGQLLAEKLGWEFIDSDSLVTAKIGLSVKEIFQKHGENHFRQLETEAIDALANRPPGAAPLVVSTGGGLPVFHNNMDKLLSLGLVVYLQARLEVLQQRVQANLDRPLLSSNSAAGDHPAGSATYKRLQQLVQERAPVYERARYKIDTSDLPAPEVVNKIALLLDREVKEQTAG